MAPDTGADARVSVTVAPEQAAWLNATAEPLILAVKSNALTVPHARASLKVAVTDVLPAVAEIETKVGGAVSTVTVLVIVGDDLPLLSTARKPKVCRPSASGAVGVNVQPAAGVPHPEQATPVVEKSPASTFASIRAMTLPNACAVPE